VPTLGLGSVFDTPEPQITPSPAQPAQIRLGDGARAIDFDVSPTGPLVALLVSNPKGTQDILFWSINREQPAKVLEMPPDFSARSLTWHPLGGILFLSD